MANDPNDASDRNYTSLLKRFCDTEDVAILTEAARLSGEFIATGVSPMDIKAIHDTAVSEVLDPEDTPPLVAAHRFLLEILFSYGAAYSVLSERLLADADEQERARALGIEHAEQSRLELLAAVSHELGNPLTVVKVNVESIRRFLEDRGVWHQDLDQREADIEFAVDRMMTLREELLAASRNEQRELEIVPVLLPRVLRRVVRWATLSASNKSIAVKEEYAHDLPYVMADEGALLSILTNLVSNAIRYTSLGGSITVEAYQDDAFVIVKVTDTGIGISDEDQLRIYERFFRAEDAKKVVVFGVGLGLAITRDLVSSLSGTIEVESRVGVGSTFKVSLPAAPLDTDEA